jgi:hypothetical protein
MDPDHRRPSQPGPSPDEPRRPCHRHAQRRPGIASVPAPRESPPDCSPGAGRRLVTGPSRASCRDASGLAVLMSTGRRAGLPGLSRPAAPAPPVARLLRITGPGRQIDIFSHCQAAITGLAGWPARAWRLIRVAGRIAARQPRRDSQLPAVGCRVSRTQGVGPARAPSRPRGWTAARQMGPVDTPGCLVGCPACSPGRGQRAGVGFRLCSCGEAAKAAWALDAPGLPEAARVRLPPADLDSGSGRARCITSAAEPCSRQRPGECAAAGGLCAS